MKFRASILVVAGLLFAISPAKAVTYTYKGNADSAYGNNYITASVDLSCAGSCAAANYIWGSGLNSFTLSILNSADAVLGTVSSTESGVNTFGYNNYVTLSSSGDINKWFLLLANSVAYIGTSNNDKIDCPPCNYSFAATDTASTGVTTRVQLYYTPGTWTISNSVAPLPAALPLFASGLGGLGLLGWRRKRKTAARAAA
jgi:hypothetical protein